MSSVLYSWRDVNPDNSLVWNCPYCKVDSCTGRTHYYAHHYNGQCLKSQQQQQQQAPRSDFEDPDSGAYVDDLGEQHTGGAAVYAREHDEAVSAAVY